MLCCIFDTVIGNIVLGSLGVKDLLKLLFSFNEKNCVTQSIYKFLYDKNKEGWNDISQTMLPEDFIRDFWDKINWGCISRYQKLSEEFISEFRNMVNWCFISDYQKLSEDFMCKFQERVDWWLICEYQTLSESFIRKFGDRVYWGSISRSQKLSEEFVREFRNRVDWWYISHHHKNCRNSFICEFRHRFGSWLVIEQHTFRDIDITFYCMWNHVLFYIHSNSLWIFDNCIYKLIADFT